jgi:urease gamma subunit
MPYMKKGKCVYKKNQDGSQGKKVGCTEGPVDDYLKALYANVDDATKKENKTMKIKKSELLALIKEEIMDEMRGLTMMDDPYDDDAVPAGMEQGGAMDQVAQEIDRMITTQMDDVISMLSNYLVTSGASRDPRRAAAMGMEMLRDAGLAFPDQSALERMIAGDDGDMMEEGMENITPENIGIVFEALGKMAPMIGAMGVPAFIVMLKEFYDERKGAQDGGEM